MWNFCGKIASIGNQAVRYLSDESHTAFHIVTHQFKNLQAATGFAGMAELRSAMMDGGVIGPPDIWFTEDAEHTAH